MYLKKYEQGYSLRLFLQTDSSFDEMSCVMGQWVGFLTHQWTKMGS